MTCAFAPPAVLDCPVVNILLTGCAGFIGSRVAARLLEDSHAVTGVDNLNDAYDPRIKRWRLEGLLGRSGLAFVQADIGDRIAVERLFDNARFDAVVNLAARAGVRQSIENPWAYFETNVTGTLNLLEVCVRHRIPRFVLASTSSLYGASNPMPFREDANTDRPLSPYAASKKAAEVLLRTYHELHGLHAAVLRYFTVYGPAGRPDMSIFRFVQRIAEGRPIVVYGDGSQKRDFTFVDDVARGTVAALQRDGFDTFNLGSDRPVALNRAIEMIEAAVGAKAVVDSKPAHPADVPATWADISKARLVLGWEPAVSFEDGIEACVRWYREHRAWASEIPTN
jgi:UDP-glucuronate 4-epimerase